MFDKKDEVLKAKVNTLIDEVASEDLDDIDETLQTRYNKREMFDAIKQLTNNNKELSKVKQNMNGEGENMDSTDRELLENSIGKIFDEKLKEKFGDLESNLKNIEKSVGQTCVDGKCFTTKLDDFQERLDSIGDIKTEVEGIKSGVDDEIGKLTDSISKMTGDFTDSISKMNEKLGDTCTGIDCINKRFSEEDDMVECPKCNHIFSLSANTVGDTVVCPKCSSISKLE